jgi:Glyoxalase-like domain
MADATNDTPALTLGAVNMSCADPALLATFWAAATGGTVSGTHGDSVYITPAPGGIPFFLQRLEGARPESHVIHLDLTAAPGTREAEVHRLTGLGAERRWDVIGEVPWVDWTTMADPEGNLFCVAEHPAQA